MAPDFPDFSASIEDECDGADPHALPVFSPSGGSGGVTTRRPAWLGVAEGESNGVVDGIVSDSGEFAAL
jgi:hypothetical protein